MIVTWFSWLIACMRFMTLVSVSPSLQMDWHDEHPPYVLCLYFMHYSAHCARPSYMACKGLSCFTMPLLCVLCVLCAVCAVRCEVKARHRNSPVLKSGLKTTWSTHDFIIIIYYHHYSHFGHLRIDLSLKWLIEVFDRPWPERLRSTIDPWTCPGSWSEILMISFGFMLDEDQKIQISMAHVVVKNRKVVKMVEFWRKEDGLRKE